MNSGKAFLIASAIALPVVGGIAYYQYAKNSITFQFIGIDFPGGNDLSNIMHINVKFAIHSDLGFSFTILQSQFNIFSGMNMLGTAMQTAPVKVGNRETVIMEANAIIDASVLGNSVFDFLLGAVSGAKDSSYMVRGEAKVKLNIPIISAFDVTIPVDEDYKV